MILVPFDGSELAEAALVRAKQFAEVFETEVMVVSVIPEDNAEYARERGWISEFADYDREEIISTLHQNVIDLYPGAEFTYETVGRSATPGAIAAEVRELADENDAKMVFVGSENAGRLVTGVSSVGGNIATEGSYDVLLVRNAEPARTARLTSEDEEVIDTAKSDFYF